MEKSGPEIALSTATSDHEESSCLKTPLLVLGGGFNEACVSTTPLLVLGVGFNEACVSTTFGSVLAIKTRIWSIVLSLSAPSSVEVEKSLLAVESLVFEKVMGI